MYTYTVPKKRSGPQWMYTYDIRTRAGSPIPRFELKGRSIMFKDLVHKIQKHILRGSWPAVCICLYAFAVSSSWAQTDQGAITGVVQDDSGAVLPAAKLTPTTTTTTLALDTMPTQSLLF